MSSVPSTALLAGPLLVGITLSCMLFGVLSAQVYFYRQKFSQDHLVVRSLVTVIYIMEVLQVIFILMFGWDIYVTGWGIPEALVTITWPDAAHSMLGAIIATIVQIFFAWRVYSLRRKSTLVRVASILIILLALLQGLSGIIGSSMFITAAAGSPNFDLRKLTKLVELWLIGSFICDFVIASAMTGILIDYSRKSMIKRTQSMLQNLIVHSVETGTVTVIAALSDLVLFLLFPDNYLHLCVNTILSKLYSNALLASLNARQGTSNGGSVYWDTRDDSNTFGSYQLSRRSNPGASGTTIHVSTHTAVDSEYRNKDASKGTQDFESDA